SGGRAAVYTTKDGLASDVVQAIAATADGRLFVGMRGGLDVLEGGRFSAFDKELFAKAQVTCILPGRDGSLWVGTAAGGLLRLRGGERTVFRKRDGLNDF